MEVSVQNHPETLQEVVEYAAFLGWTITIDQAKFIQDTYASPGGDGMWRNYRGLIPDWHRCIVVWRAHEITRQDKRGSPSPVLRPAKCVLCGKVPTRFRHDVNSHICDSCYEKWPKEHTCACGQPGRFRRQIMGVACDACLEKALICRQQEQEEEAHGTN